jgi:hypothetical protein
MVQSGQLVGMIVSVSRCSSAQPVAVVVPGIGRSIDCRYSVGRIVDVDGRADLDCLSQAAAHRLYSHTPDSQ